MVRHRASRPMFLVLKQLQHVLFRDATLARLHGPHSLTAAGVSNNVKGIGPGAYALGNTNEKNVFIISYVGRSDDDLAARLQQHVSEPYLQFKYGFLDTAAAAFDKECRLYHDFDPPDNKVHPARPKNAKWSCPVCTIFD
jgi:hypothetical protein